MAYLCTNCHLIFTDSRTCCPTCGKPATFNNTMIDNLHLEGYQLANQVKSNPSSILEETRVTIDDNDIIASLRKEHQEEHGKPPTTHGQMRGNIPPSQDRNNTENITGTASQESIINQKADSSSETTGYFRQFQSGGVNNDIPTVSPPPANGTSYTEDSSASDALLDDIERESRRIRRRYHLEEAWRTFRNLPWGTIVRIVFLILIALFVVVSAMTAWSKRFVILFALKKFLVSLLSIIILIWFFVYLIRILFH